MLYIDTENTFRPERVRAVANRFDLDPEGVLNNILVGRAFTVDSLINLLM